MADGEKRCLTVTVNVKDEVKYKLNKSNASYTNNDTRIVQRL